MAFERFGSDRSPVQKTGTDKLFGAGIDGTVTVSTNTSLSRDMYYANLTVNSSVTLFTNGFRIFVSGTLTNNGTIGMPKGTAMTTSVLGGTVLTRVNSNAGWTANQSYDSVNSSGNLSFAATNGVETALEGLYTTGSGLLRAYAGTYGIDGSANPGGAGSGGNSTAGNPGTAGLGGQGGGAVVVLAKTISGSGIFISEGTDGGAGSNGNAGATQPGTQFHNPGGHNPGGHASGHNPPGHASGHNPGSHNPAQSFHHPAGCCAWNGAHHHDHHSHHHVNQNAWHHPGNAFSHSHPGNQFHHSHPGNSHPGNAGHNPTYPGGAAGTGNPGNPGKGGGMYVLTRGISTHVASGNMTLVEDLDN